VLASNVNGAFNMTKYYITLSPYQVAMLAKDSLHQKDYELIITEEDDGGTEYRTDIVDLIQEEE
jgi:hypothetical protein